jgi:hypothetical protein
MHITHTHTPITSSSSSSSSSRGRRRSDWLCVYALIWSRWSLVGSEKSVFMRGKEQVDLRSTDPHTHPLK